jgi:hypothetical protein
MSKRRWNGDQGDQRPGEPRPSGAPEAGGATTHGSQFGGRSTTAMLLRALARWSRTVEAMCYRRLRDMDDSAREPSGARGRPFRVRGAAHHTNPHPHPHRPPRPA